MIDSSSSWRKRVFYQGIILPPVLLWRQIRRVILPILLLLSLRVSVPNAQGQSAGLPQWDVLAEESTAVVVGDVEEANLWVIDPAKKARAEVTPEGKPTFANPALYILGILGRVRIREVLKGSGLRAGETIGILTYGYIASDKPMPVMKGKRYVLFLRPLGKEQSTFKDAVIERYGPPGSIAKRERFDTKDCYTPVWEGFGQVILTPERMKLLDELRRSLAKRP